METVPCDSPPDVEPSPDCVTGTSTIVWEPASTEAGTVTRTDRMPFASVVAVVSSVGTECSSTATWEPAANPFASITSSTPAAT